MSLRIVPSAGHATTTPATTLAPSAPVHDALRNGISTTASQINDRHPLQHRLEQWHATQLQLKLDSMRRIYGSAEPIRREMEMFCCREGVRHTGYAMERGVGMDILLGTDTKLEVEDIWTGSELGRGGEYREAMEKKMVRGL